MVLHACQSDEADIPKDSDGDGITDELEGINGTDKNNPCDPVQAIGYVGYDLDNAQWSAADCDGDGVSNGNEVTDATDPYKDDTPVDSDGDGIIDDQEITDGTDLNNPCDPVQNSGYTAFDSTNTTWSTSDCDEDGTTNGDELALDTDPYFDERVFAVAEFLPKLSELQLFDGELSDLKFNTTVHEYSLSTPLFTDYSYKLRSIALPKDAQTVYDGEGLLVFPDNTVITKTFYYLNDERDPLLGRKIIETRLLIKKNGNWTLGNYIWNDEQTEAFLDENFKFVTINWIDASGSNRTVDYRVPNKNNCFQCHDNSGSPGPIGPKARALNFMFKGNNQLQYFKDKELLTGAPDIAQIPVLPNWTDLSMSVSERARAYLDVNCAHCHQPGGTYNLANGDNFEFRYETAFDDTNIFDTRASIQDRISVQIANYFMPYIGTSVIHTEGVDLINEYIDSL